VHPGDGLSSDSADFYPKLSLFNPSNLLGGIGGMTGIFPSTTFGYAKKNRGFSDEAEALMDVDPAKKTQRYVYVCIRIYVYVCM
jgi:hypothetical protein